MMCESRLFKLCRVAFVTLFLVAIAKSSALVRESPRVSARNVVELKKHVGREILVFGKIERTNRSRSGHQFLTFETGQLTVFVSRDHIGKFGSAEPYEKFRGQRVEIRGKLELFKNKLQIKVLDPKQISTVNESKPKTGSASFGLKKIGEETWLSPAGLRYSGRDPAGLTRVQHVLRHAKDIPNRDGPHGVFDGGYEKTFHIIDEAWRLIEKQKTRPRMEGERSAYTVHMRRKVGYLGGRTGKSKRNPPLYRVFIVVKTGTKDVITAFPK